MTPLMTVENFFAVAMLVLLIFCGFLLLIAFDDLKVSGKIGLQQDGRYAIVGRYLRHVEFSADP